MPDLDREMQWEDLPLGSEPMPVDEVAGIIDDFAFSMAISTPDEEFVSP